MGTASAGYLKPAVGVLIGCTVMGESLTWIAMVGLSAIFVGVAMINQRELVQRIILLVHRRLRGEFAGQRAPARVPFSN